jgi:hypothetical protein
MSSFKQTRPPLHIGVFVNLQQVQRRHLLLSAVLSSPRPWNSRISAVMTMSPADDLLQKQQKQREGRFARGCCLGRALRLAT